MIKIVCTTEKEKKELIEAAYLLSILDGLDRKVPGLNFLANLYKNPGDIEISEDGAVSTTRRVRAVMGPLQQAGGW